MFDADLESGDAASLRTIVLKGRATLISVGPSCTGAAILKALRLRLAAYPFDWLFSSLPMVRQCLEDDFAAFLDPDQIEPVPIEQRLSPDVQRAHHRLYRAMGVEHVFNHHEMPAALPHFRRAVERFRSARNPVFLYVARDQADHAELEGVRRRLAGPMICHFGCDVSPEGFVDAEAERRFVGWLRAELAG